MSSRQEPASEEERAAIAVLDGFARRVARTRERYVDLVGRGDRIHREIQAMQAARGVRVLVGGTAVSVLASTRDSAAEQPYSKAAAGWKPMAGLVSRAAQTGAGAWAAVGTSAADVAEASSSAGATVLSCEFRAAVQRRWPSIARSRSRGEHGSAVAVACGDVGGEAFGGSADTSYLRLP